MRKMRKYRDYLIEKLSDREKAISYLQTALEEYRIDGDSVALHLAFSQAVEAQGGVQEFALRTHSDPQAVSDALLSKDETQIARVIARLAEESYEGSVIYGEAKKLPIEDFIAPKSPDRSMPVDNILASITQKYGDEAIAFGSSTLDSLDGMEGQSETPWETLEDRIHALYEDRLSSRNTFSKEAKVKSSRSKSYRVRGRLRSLFKTRVLASHVAQSA